MRTVGAPGITVGPNAKRHTRGWPASWGAPCQSNVVDWFPISGGGAPSSVPTAERAAAHEAPASSAATNAAITVSQNRRAISIPLPAGQRPTRDRQLGPPALGLGHQLQELPVPRQGRGHVARELRGAGQAEQAAGAVGRER